MRAHRACRPASTWQHLMSRWGRFALSLGLFSTRRKPIRYAPLSLNLLESRDPPSDTLGALLGNLGIFRSSMGLLSLGDADRSIRIGQFDAGNSTTNAAASGTAVQLPELETPRLSLLPSVTEGARSTAAPADAIGKSGSSSAFQADWSLNAPSSEFVTGTAGQSFIPSSAATDRPPASGQIAPNGLPNFNAYSGSNGGANAPDSSAQSGQFIPPAPEDGDGIAAATESQAPNHGDGNRDGIADANQRDVASLRAKTDGSFVTLESSGHTLTNVRAFAAPNTAANLPLGLFAFEIHDVTPGGAATVNMILPEGFTTNSYLKQDSSGALQPFDFDGTTGAEFNGNVVTLHFIDGGRGDADGVANGTIVDPSGPNTPIGGGGGGSQAVLQFSSATYAVFEDAGAATITVVRTGDTSGAASVHFATSDGTATQPADYAAATGTLNFAANEISKTFSVNVVNDGVTESPETVHLTLSNPTGATIGTPNPADLTISDPFSNGSIGDRVWTDRNCNGLQDAGEPGRSGVSLQLLKNGVEVATTTSGADGSYSFTSLSAGTYVVQAFAPVDYQFTTQNVGSDRSIDSNGNPDGTSGEIVIDAAHPSDNTIDFGLVSTARIGDFVWVDQNVNGLQDAGEPGLPGISVHLLNGSGAELYSTLTDANGKYAFGDLVVGNTYKVRFDQPSFYYFTEEHVGGGSNSSTDSDADSTGLTDSIVAVADLNLDSVDAGLVSRASVGNFVWDDRNANGIQDGGEPGLPNVQVTLKQLFGPQRTMNTDSNGFYRFDGLDPSQYYSIAVQPPTGYAFTFFQQGANRFVDSDVVASTGETNTFNVPADVYDMSIDAGLINMSNRPRGQIVGPGAVPGNSVYSYTITWDNNVVAPQWQIRITDPVNPPPDVVTPIVIHGAYYDPNTNTTSETIDLQFGNSVPADVFLEAWYGGQLLASKEILVLL